MPKPRLETMPPHRGFDVTGFSKVGCEIGCFGLTVAFWIYRSSVPPFLRLNLHNLFSDLLCCLSRIAASGKPEQNYKNQKVRPKKILL
mmetsp:Transcript_39881/g.85416  ORF Transcript_39881/g.85416 Transcript_39881/m.85416 type:complete len:88 (+) Transcript_39881:512-775(+)